MIVMVLVNQLVNVAIHRVVMHVVDNAKNLVFHVKVKDKRILKQMLPHQLMIHRWTLRMKFVPG